jgi:hypothetical protein
LSHDDIAALVPWYAAGTLDVRDKARVELAVSEARELAHEFDRAKEERLETIRLNESIGAPSGRVLANLLDAIDSEPRPSRQLRVATRANAADRLTRFIAGLSPRALAWSAMAGIAVVVLQTGVLASIILAGPHAGLDLAGTPGKAAFAEIRFTATATAAEMNQYLDAYHVQVVRGPKLGDLYEIQLPATGQAKLDLIEQMRRDAIVDLIAAE